MVVCRYLKGLKVFTRQEQAAALQEGRKIQSRQILAERGDSEGAVAGGGGRAAGGNGAGVGQGGDVASAGGGAGGASAKFVGRWFAASEVDATVTITVGAGLTSSTATSGSYKITTLTAGTGVVNW